MNKKRKSSLSMNIIDMKDPSFPMQNYELENPSPWMNNEVTKNHKICIPTSYVPTHPSIKTSPKINKSATAHHHLLSPNPTATSHVRLWVGARGRMTLVNSLLADLHVASPDSSSCFEESAWFRRTGGGLRPESSTERKCAD
jgi:hypothetical protein